MKWIVAALLILVVSLVLQMDLLAYAMYVLLGVIWGSRWLARIWARSITAQRECSRTEAEVGDLVAVNVIVENTGRLPIAWVLLEDVLPPRALVHDPPALALQGERMQVVMFKPKSRRTMMYRMRCNRRGYYQLGPLLVETGDLFGLHRKFRIATEPHFLLVLPKVVPLEGYEIASRRPIGEVTMAHRLYEDPTRIAGVREYQPGDPLNRVNWRATARTGTLHSKVYEPSSIAGATILLDFHRKSFDKANEPVRSDLAVTAAASIANTVYEMGQQIGLVTNARDAADRIRIEGYRLPPATRKAARRQASRSVDSDRLRPIVIDTQRGPEQIRAIMETLARAELTSGLNFTQLLLEVGSRIPRDATVIAILRNVTDEHVVALDELRRQGYAVSAIVSEYEPYEFSQRAGPLIAAGISVHQLRDEASIAGVCRRMASIGCRI